MPTEIVAIKYFGSENAKRRMMVELIGPETFRYFWTHWFGEEAHVKISYLSETGAITDKDKANFQEALAILSDYQEIYFLNGRYIVHLMLRIS